jgi:glycosyltransferase involved in cell wall biosynthesis
MKLLIVTQYFWPENFRINDLSLHFAQLGHKVSVITGIPNYPEGTLNKEYEVAPHNFSKYGDVEIHRVRHVLRGKTKRSLFLNYLTYFLNASLQIILKHRKVESDVVFVFAVSPITVAIPAIIYKFFTQKPVLLWVQDLWPETLSATGVVRSPKILKLIGLLVKWIYANCDYILIQSPAFEPSVRQYCSKAVDQKKIFYLPNWAEQVFKETASEPRSIINKQSDKFTILFAGNIGDAQDFPSILSAAQKTKAHSHIRWVIVGDGRKRQWVQTEVERLGLVNCFYLAGHFPIERMPGFYAAADALLVSLKANDVFAKTIPGKLQSYLAAGKPIIGLISGEAQNVIHKSGAGNACDSGDSEQLAKIVLEMASMNGTQLQEMGAKARLYYEQHYERDTVFKKLEDYFKMAISLSKS